MDRREKTEFILEQMRLLIALARLKDGEIGHEGKDSIGGGESEWVKVRVGGRKVNEEFLKDKANEVSLVIAPNTARKLRFAMYTGFETQVLRHDDPICTPRKLVSGCRQVLLQGLGNTNDQGGSKWSWS